MARAPVAGETKTRLQPHLGPEGCARLQAALVRRAAALDGPALDGGARFLAHTPADGADLLRPLVGPRTVLFPQRDGDLGQRMAAAVEDATTRGAGPVIVIGTDCPVLATAHLSAVAVRLARGDDVVLGPAHDGGYYLIALAHPAAGVFALPTSAWGGPDVAARTVRAAESLGLTVGFLGPEHDLDTPDDAQTLLLDPRVPPDIAAILRSPPTAAGPGR